MAEVTVHNIVETKDLRVNFGKVNALDGVSLTIRKGEIFGLVGADGAGKTTLERVIATLCHSTSGTCTVMDHDTRRDKSAIRRSVGFVHASFSLYPDLSIDENIEFYAAINGVEFDKSNPLIASIYQDIAPFGDRLAGRLSGGMKQKLAMCCALIHRPKILILDEPTTGIDATSREEIWHELSRLNRAYDITIIVSTPYRNEIMMCHRIARMDSGHIIEVGEPHKIMPVETKLERNFSSTDETENIIEIHHLVKAFGSFKAVNDISFEVKKGEIFGFLGANGAGKTTAINILCGLTHATSGSGHVAGCDIMTNSEEIKKHIGYMSQRFALYEDLTVRQNLTFFSGIYGIPPSKAEPIIDKRLEDMGFNGMDNRIVGTLPLGWKQRLSFAVATLHNPEIVFLDEPTSGVDVETRHHMWEIINAEAARGTTIFITTHYMDEATYCDRQSIMVSGKICAMGHLQSLISLGVSPDYEDIFDLITKAMK